MFMGYPTNPINHMKEKCFNGYFLIHLSLSKTDKDATIISSFIGFLRNILIKYFLTALVFCYAEK